MQFLKSKLFWSIILLLLVFIVYFLPINDIWFSVDDCGNIISGIVRSFRDLLSVFGEDERNYLYPINFNVPESNFISGFYRPMQHIVFSVIYYFFGFNVKVYYFVNVLFHSLNTVLFFYLISFFVPLYLAFLSGLLFAFYPIMDWITWVSTLHNFLAIFFMFISLILFRLFWISKKFVFNFLGAISFLLSICSRENTVVLGAWLFITVFIFSKSKYLLNRIKVSLIKTWPFMCIYLIYFLIRLFVFGWQTLPRTLNNIILRLSMLKTFFG